MNASHKRVVFKWLFLMMMSFEGQLIWRSTQTLWRNMHLHIFINIYSQICWLTGAYQQVLPPSCVTTAIRCKWPAEERESYTFFKKPKLTEESAAPDWKRWSLIRMAFVASHMQTIGTSSTVLSACCVCVCCIDILDSTL